MEALLRGLVSGEALASWLVLAFFVGYFAYKEWPDFRRRISSDAVKDEKEKSAESALETRLAGIETHLTGIDASIAEVSDKLARDYQRINEIERMQKKHERIQDNSQEELEIIMRALLGVLRGLQEQGADGPTRAAEAELQDYLNRKAHKSDDDGEEA